VVTIDSSWRFDDKRSDIIVALAVVPIYTSVVVHKHVMVKKRCAHQGRKNDLQKNADLKGHKILVTFGRGNGNN